MLHIIFFFLLDTIILNSVVEGASPFLFCGIPTYTGLMEVKWTIFWSLVNETLWSFSRHTR